MNTKKQHDKTIWAGGTFVCDSCTWQFFHFPASKTPPASVRRSCSLMFLCAGGNQGRLATGSWIYGIDMVQPSSNHLNKYFLNKDICSQCSGWTWTAKLTHARNNDQHAVWRILRRGRIWVLPTASQNMVQLPCIGWEGSRLRSYHLGVVPSTLIRKSNYIPENYMSPKKGLFQ